MGNDMQLEMGRSYILIFYGYAVLFLLAMVLTAIGADRFGFAIIGVTMPILLLFLLISEIRSGIALDSWWVAKYQRGTWQFTGIIAWQSTGLLVVLTVIGFAIAMGLP